MRHNAQESTRPHPIAGQQAADPAPAARPRGHDLRGNQLSRDTRSIP